MTSHSDRPRRFTDEEVRYLLKRASELESEGSSLPARAEGPTLHDLEAIASEAGIDPALLRQAARELDSASLRHSTASSLGTSLLGAPAAVELERTVPWEVSSQLLESLVPAIQRAADGVGHPSLMGRTLTWQSTDSSKARVLQVSVNVGRGETRLMVEERYANLAGGLFGGIMGGVGGGVGFGVGLGVGVGALGSVLFATVFPISMLGVSYLIARTAYRTTVHGRSRTLNRLMDEMVRIVEDELED